MNTSESLIGKYMIGGSFIMLLFHKIYIHASKPKPKLWGVIGQNVGCSNIMWSMYGNCTIWNGVFVVYSIHIIHATTRFIATNQNQNKIRCYFKCLQIVINVNQRFGLTSKYGYGFHTNSLLKNDIKIPTETFENQTCQYMNWN